MMSKYSGNKSLFDTWYRRIRLTLQNRIVSPESSLKYFGGKSTHGGYSESDCYLIYLVDTHRCCLIYFIMLLWLICYKFCMAKTPYSDKCLKIFELSSGSSLSSFSESSSWTLSYGSHVSAKYGDERILLSFDYRKYGDSWTEHSWLLN